jgi:UDP-N-acetylmuramate dehydrogenase
MQIQENISLKPYNTFSLDASARYFAQFKNLEELEEALSFQEGISTMILGGGSNILLTKNFDGLVLKNEIKGITELHEDNEFVYIKAGAGENWHQFVLYCINRNWAGIENLSLIPGNVGASPMQNIGAYGVEIDDVFWDLEAWHLKEKKVITFTKSDCEFGYRESVFKGKYKNQFIILNVTFQLRKKPRYNISYGAIGEELERMGVNSLSVKAISDAVINIRNSKLPDPAIIGNAGSFFKNPEVSGEQFALLQQSFPSIIGYKLPSGNVKLAAGWLIEQCGPENNISWKGYRKGDAGCYAKQALVLVNYGNATGNDIYDLSNEIILSVKQRFNVTLEKEVNIF